MSGAAKRNPARFKDRAPVVTAPLGEPSAWLTDEQRIAWELYRVEAPHLMESDRGFVEVASCLRARVMRGEQVSAGVLNLLRLCARQLRLS